MKSSFRFALGALKITTFAVFSCLLLGAGSFRATAQTGPGTAPRFDGVNDYVSVPSTSSLNLGSQFTIELWLYQKAANVGSGFRLVDKETSGLQDGYLLDTYDGVTGRKLRMAFGGGVWPASAAYTLNTWHHAAATYNSGTLSFYLDGATNGAFTGVAAPASNALDLRIGAPHVGCGGGCGLVEYFNGIVDEVRIWNVARSQAQIQANMNHSVALPQTNLVGYWRFDEGTSTNTFDASGRGDTGTLVNGPLWVASTVPLLPTDQILVYSENFDTDHSLDNTWVTNSVGGYNPVNLYFDYSTVGIPSAPNSVGGTTRGLKLQANLNPAVQVFPSGSSASPNGLSIAQDFEMRWDWWPNFNGPLNAGGAGSTQIGGAGFGTAATTANVPTIIDAIFIGASGDGGSTADYRAYTPAFSGSLQDASGVYAAGTVGSRDNTNAYYQSTFPPQSATNNCPAQLALYPQQTGLTQGGSPGIKWHDVSLKKVANILTYSIDGLLIATIDASTNGTLGGSNIVFGQFDINAAASPDTNAANLAFSLVDNVRITVFTYVVTVPTVTTQPASAITTNSVTLNGTVNPHGQSTAAWFLWEIGRP